MTLSQLSMPVFLGPISSDMADSTGTTYYLHGQMLGIGCTCSTCTCVSCGCFSLFDNMVGYQIEKGWIEGVDVSGVMLMRVDYSSSNTEKASTANTSKTLSSGTILYIAEQATERQRDVIIRAFTGQLGGVLADLSHLLGHRPEIRIAPIQYCDENGQKSLVVTDKDVVLTIAREPRQGLARLITQVFEQISRQLTMAIAHLTANILGDADPAAYLEKTLESRQSSHSNQFCFEA